MKIHLFGHKGLHLDPRIVVPIRSMKSRWPAIILCSVFICLMIIPCVLGSIEVYRRNNNLTEIRETTGTIISYKIVDYYNKKTDDYEERYNYKTEYVYNDHVYYFEAIFRNKDYEVGDDVLVEYNIENLNNAKIIKKNFSYYSNRYGLLILGICGMVFGIIGIIIVNIEYNKRQRRY